MNDVSTTLLTSIEASRGYWVSRIEETWLHATNSLIEGVFQTGDYLLEAKEGDHHLEHGEFIKMIEDELPFGERTARMLMAIARDERLTKRKHVSVLPPSWGTLYQLSRLDDDTFTALLEDGTIRPDLERSEITKIHYLAKRKDKHERIARGVALAHIKEPDKFGPFPLIYADPPWVFETYTPDNTHRMPDDHYPTLPDQEIIDFKVFGRTTIPELAGEDSALFLWCTSSNLERALAVLRCWGFTYKTHAVWDKEKIGLGLIFRNQHEVLLYGSRGDPPKPMQLPSSVFRYPRTTHSAKPPEIRAELERMYPVFNEQTRIELFARGQVERWTCVGYEANSDRTAAVA